MKLLPNVMYRAKVENVSFGRMTAEELLEVLGSGRMCGVLLEHEIAHIFEDCKTAPAQGDNPDIISEELGDIQAKTWRQEEESFFKSGPRKGLSKWLAKSIFTTKSGLWDSLKRRIALGEDVDKTIREYFDKYDYFMYIDIQQFGKDYTYSFIVLETEYVKSVAVNGYIAPQDILSQVKEEMYV